MCKKNTNVDFTFPMARLLLLLLAVASAERALFRRLKSPDAVKLDALFQALQTINNKGQHNPNAPWEASPMHLERSDGEVRIYNGWSDTCSFTFRLSCVLREAHEQFNKIELTEQETCDYYAPVISNRPYAEPMFKTWQTCLGYGDCRDREVTEEWVYMMCDH